VREGIFREGTLCTEYFVYYYGLNSLFVLELCVSVPLENLNISQLWAQVMGVSGRREEMSSTHRNHAHCNLINQFYGSFNEMYRNG
jgi:hypothetical protein